MNTGFHTDDDVKRYVGFLADEIEDRLGARFDVLDDMREKVNRIPAIEARLERIESTITVHDLVIREHDREIKDLQSTVQK